MTDYAFTWGVLKAAKERGYDCDQLAAMVRQSAPVTHPDGNRRYEDLVFDVTDEYGVMLVQGIHDFAISCKPTP